MISFLEDLSTREVATTSNRPREGRRDEVQDAKDVRQEVENDTIVNRTFQFFVCTFW